MQPRPISPPAPIIAFFAWLLPGSGHIILGQRARGLTIGITILVLFALGLFIGGLRVVELPGTGRTDSAEPGLMGAIKDKPWFVPQALTGPVSLVVATISANGAGSADHPATIPVSHSRVAEIGTLYCAIAGMLNLMAMIDAGFRAGQGGGKK